MAPAENDKVQTDESRSGDARLSNLGVVDEYTKYLRAQTNDHREFLEHFYHRSERLVKLFAILIAAGIAFFGWNAWTNIENQVNSLFDKEIRAILNSEMEKIRIELAQAKNNAKDQAKVLLEGIRRDTESLRRDLNVVATQSVAQRKGDANRTTSSKTVLLVDDNPSNNSYIIGLLKSMGIMVKEALNTIDAEKALKDYYNKFDLIITDIRRGGDEAAGINFVKWINEQKINVPVVIYSSPESLDFFRSQVVALGTDAAVSEYGELFDEFKRWIGVDLTPRIP